MICEYKYNKMMRFLIDPTFEQFTRMNDKILIGMDYWPSDKLNVNTLNCLLTDGVVEIDEEVLGNYLNSFGSDEIIEDLDDYLLNMRINKFRYIR